MSARIIGTAGQMGNPLHAVNGRYAPPGNYF